MPTSNEEILDEYIRHQTYLLRYASGLTDELLPTIVKTEKDLYESILSWTARLDGDRILAGTKGRKWQSDFENVINQIRNPAWQEVTKETMTQLKELAVAEAAMGASVISSSVPVILDMALPPASKLIAVVNSQPFQGRTLRGWMENTARADVERILAHAKTGITMGETPSQVARRIIGTKAGGWTDGMARTSFKDLESVLLTVTNGIQQEAKQALYEANSDIINEELYVATLDIRTTPECAVNDGKRFKLGKGPIPPLHFRCRSLRVPYINPDNLRNRGFDSSTEKELLQEYRKKANIGPVSNRSNLPKGHKGAFDAFARKRRGELIGQVPAKKNFTEWFGSQSKGFQDEWLGPTRAQMYREGNLPLSKFVARDGNLLTLEQLKDKGFKIPKN